MWTEGPRSLLAVGQGPPSFSATWACPGVTACVSRLHRGELREMEATASCALISGLTSLRVSLLLLEASHGLPRSTRWECVTQGCEYQEVGGVAEAATQAEDLSSSMSCCPDPVNVL